LASFAVKGFQNQKSEIKNHQCFSGFRPFFHIAYIPEPLFMRMARALIAASLAARRIFGGCSRFPLHHFRCTPLWTVCTWLKTKQMQLRKNC
jgi:hypothetical protein